MWIPFIKTYTRKCGDRIITLYKNPDHAFPLYVKTTDSSAKLKASLQQQATASVNAELRPHVDALFFEVDEQNASLMASFRAAYIRYAAEPCGGQERFDEIVDLLIQRQQRLAEARINMRGLIALASQVDDRSRFLEAYQRIVDTVGGQAIGRAVVLEIEESQEATKEWTGGDEDDS